MTWATKTIGDIEPCHSINKQGTLVVIIPVMSNRYGLTRNMSIQRVGERIRGLTISPAAAVAV